LCCCAVVDVDDDRIGRDNLATSLNMLTGEIVRRYVRVGEVWTRFRRYWGTSASKYEEFTDNNTQAPNGTTRSTAVAI
jgi:hypothetical protein